MSRQTRLTTVVSQPPRLSGDSSVRKGMTGPVDSWHVDDIEATFAALVAAGTTEQQGIQSVGGTRRIATVADQDGNVLGLLQP